MSKAQISDAEQTLSVEQVAVISYLRNQEVQSDRARASASSDWPTTERHMDRHLTPDTLGRYLKLIRMVEVIHLSGVGAWSIKGN